METIEDEKTLLNEIESQKKSIAETLYNDLSEEREKQHADNKVLFYGAWTPKEKLNQIIRKLLTREFIIFFETNIIIFSVTIIIYIIWILFVKLFMP